MNSVQLWASRCRVLLCARHMLGARGKDVSTAVLKELTADKGMETAQPEGGRGGAQRRGRCCNGDTAGGKWPLVYLLTLRTQQV